MELNKGAACFSTTDSSHRPALPCPACDEAGWSHVRARDTQRSTNSPNGKTASDIFSHPALLRHEIRSDAANRIYAAVGEGGG